MSARQPFVPQRSVSNNPDKGANPNSNTPLTESQPQSKKIMMDLGTNKPLNLSGLIKPRSSNNQQQQNYMPDDQTEIGNPALKSRRSLEGIQRPMKPAIFTKNQGSIKSRMSDNSLQQQNQNPNLPTSPFFLTSSSTPSSSFSTSASSNASGAFIGFQLAPRSNSDSNVNANMTSGDKDTHISTFSQNPVESALTMPATNLHAPLSQIRESTQESSVSPFANVTRSKENINNSVDFRDTSSSPSTSSTNGGVGASGLGFGVAVLGGIASLGGTGQKKRNHAGEQDEENEHMQDESEDAGQTKKRRKDDGGQVEYISTSKSNSFSARRANPKPDSNSSTNHQQQRQHNPDQHYYRESSAQNPNSDHVDELHEQEHQHQDLHSLFHNSSRQPTAASSCPPPRPQSQGHALLTLFGTDLDTYVAHHAEEYEAEKVKWAGCEMEEWVKGSDDLVEEYGGLIDFVKDHMTKKMFLHASLNQNVTDYRTVLSERAKVLEHVQKGMVKDGEVLI